MCVKVKKVFQNKTVAHDRLVARLMGDKALIKIFCPFNHKNIDNLKSNLLMNIAYSVFELRESGEMPLQKTAAVIPTPISLSGKLSLWHTLFFGG